MPPEVLLRRKAARTDRIVRAVAVLLVLAMIGGGVARFLSVHNAENQKAAATQNVASISALIAKYNKAQQEYSRLRADEALFSPVVAGEVNWPAVLLDLAKATPNGGTITSLTGAATPPATTKSTTAAPPASSLPIASLTLTIVAPSGYPYFETWYDSVLSSGQFQIEEWSSIQPVGGKSTSVVTYSATLEALGTIQSSRLSEFKVAIK